jgi:hypothetical protein
MISETRTDSDLEILEWIRRVLRNVFFLKKHMAKLTKRKG